MHISKLVVLQLVPCSHKHTLRAHAFTTKTTYFGGGGVGDFLLRKLGISYAARWNQVIKMQMWACKLKHMRMQVKFRFLRFLSKEIHQGHWTWFSVYFLFSEGAGLCCITH
jgi:hypothetical protein